jgi:hypothetical protein
VRPFSFSEPDFVVGSDGALSPMGLEVVRRIWYESAAKNEQTRSFLRRHHSRMLQSAHSNLVVELHQIDKEYLR